MAVGPQRVHIKRCKISKKNLELGPQMGPYWVHSCNYFLVYYLVMDDIPTKKLVKAFIADMDPFTKKLIKVFIAIVLLVLIYDYY